MSEPLAYLQGRYLLQSQATLSLNDAGFVQGVTITDLCRTFRQQLFRWPEHLARFRHSCRLAYLKVDHTDQQLHEIAQHLLQHNAALLNPDHELALVLFATPGPIGYYLGQPGGAGSGRPTFGMHTFPLPFDRYRRIFQEGARLVVPHVRSVPAACVDPAIKQRSRLHWWLADQEVRKIDPQAWALLADHEGLLTETAAANFLLVEQGTVLSPPRSSILPGVSLAVVEELCISLGIPFQERPLKLTECLRADEVMLTGTVFSLAGVRRVNEMEFHWPGPICQKLLAAWSELAGLDIAGQFVGVP